MEQIERYGIFESRERAEGTVTGLFTCGEIRVRVKAFSVGKGEVMVRFRPECEGRWEYRILDGEALLREGSFFCTPARPGNHGPVSADGFGFRYADGTEYRPFGTTCYAWIYQPEEIRKQTLETLADSPFNKVRMCVFPKDMIYNEEEPPCFPYEKKANGLSDQGTGEIREEENGSGSRRGMEIWDMERPNPAFWDRLEENLRELDRLGIEADLILFHPYDRWGFAEMSGEDNLRYLEYGITRLAAFKNIWWSLANEYDLMPEREESDWEGYARKIQECDPYGHPMSIHNCFQPYGKREWMTHCSLQTAEPKAALEMRMRYGIPVLIDECGYEGDIPFDWGNLSAFEMTHRIWTGCIRGGYCSHGETYESEDNRLWWSKGGRLRGESVARIAFLRGILEELPGRLEPFCWKLDTDPNGKKQEGADTPFARAMMRLEEGERNRRILDMLPMALYNENCWLQYLGRSCQRRITVNAPGGGSFRAELIDVWEMSRSCVSEEFQGSVSVELPGKEGIAVLLTRRS